MTKRVITRALHLRYMPSARIDERVSVVDSGLGNFFICAYEGGLVAFDTGYRAGVAKSGMASLGLDPAAVTHVFLTHTDFDHVGGLPAFPHAHVYISEDEEPLVAGKRLPRLYGIYRNHRLKAYTLLADGQAVQVGAMRVQAIKTPGHTIGSMCYLVDGDTLFSGDTLAPRNGRLGPNLQFYTDIIALWKSYAKLERHVECKRLFTSHWGAFS